MGNKPRLLIVGKTAKYKGLGYEIEVMGDEIEIIWNIEYIQENNYENECFESAFKMLKYMKTLIN